MKLRRSKKESDNKTDSVDSDVKQKDSAAQDSSKISTNMSKNKKRKMIIIDIVIFIILCLAIVGYLIYKGENKENTDSTNDDITYSRVEVCTAKENVNILNKSVEAINNNNPATASESIKNIETLASYEQDPYCLYSVSRLSVNISDAERARKEYDLLIKTDITNEELYQVFGDSLTPKEDLLSFIELVEENNKLLEGNLLIPTDETVNGDE